MRPLLISILTFVLFSSYAQTGRTKIFKRTEYINGNIYRQLFDTIRVSNDRVDLYFYKNHFYIPYYLPDKFVNKRYKNKKVSVWANSKGKKDYKKNWENTYTYDGLNRVTSFTFSGCFICSSFPYNYAVTYNSKGQVDKIVNTINEKDSFKFYYNNEGYADKLEKYLFGKLETIIALIN